MFSGSTRTGHEAQAGPLILKIIGAAEGKISHKELSRWVRDRDRELALEGDSSQLNFFLLDILVAEFPDARFVLTIRDAYSWLDSIINHILNHPQTTPEWLRMRDFRFRPDIYKHAPAEHVLKDKGLHTVEGYLAYWAEHNGKTVAKVPSDRLLVVQTGQIRSRAKEIAAFAGLPPEAVDLEGAHSFKNPQKFNIVRQLDRAFIEEKIAKHCRPLMTQFFPEIKSFDDARL